MPRSHRGGSGRSRVGRPRCGGEPDCSVDRLRPAVGRAAARRDACADARGGFHGCGVVRRIRRRSSVRRLLRHPQQAPAVHGAVIGPSDALRGDGDVSPHARRRPHRPASGTLDDPARVSDRSQRDSVPARLRPGGWAAELAARERRRAPAARPRAARDHIDRAAFLAPVPNDQSVDSITLADGDSGRVARVARGQTVVIRLSSNRSTGYRWTLAPFPAGVVTPLGDPVYTSAGAPSGAVGAGGVEAWSFLASESGRQELRFEYRRPWEREVAAARILRYTIAVQ